MLSMANFLQQKNPKATELEDRFQSLAFKVSDGDFCVEILNVKEIRSYTPTTKIPDSKYGMLGIINIRGNAINIYDIKTMIGYGSTEIGTNSVIIIVCVRGKDVGILVDAVSDIIEFTKDQVRSSDEAASSDGMGSLNDKYVKGVAFIQEKPYIILSLDNLFRDL